MIENNQNLEFINENSTILNTNVILLVSDLLRVLENEWYSKLKNKQSYTNLAHYIFSLLHYQVTLIQQLSEYYIETYSPKEIEPILSFNKNIISKKIEKIIYFNDNDVRKRCVTRACTTQNSFYNKNFDFKMKNLSVNPCHHSLYNKPRIPVNEKLYISTLSNDNSRNYLDKLEENSSYKYLIDEKPPSQIYLNTYSNKNNDTNNNSNNTFNNNYSINLIQKNIKKVCENPVKKVKDIIMNAKQKNNQSSGSSINKKNFKEVCDKKLPSRPNLFYGSPNTTLYQSKCDKNNYLSNRSSLANIDNNKNNRTDKDLEKNEKLIIKVETIKDRGTKELLYDGMKNIKKRLKSREKSKVKLGNSMSNEAIKYFLKNKINKNQYINNKQKKK